MTTPPRPWSVREDETLAREYPTATPAELLKLLPGRTINAIHCRASLRKIAKAKLGRPAKTESALVAYSANLSKAVTRFRAAERRANRKQLPHPRRDNR